MRERPWVDFSAGLTSGLIIKTVSGDLLSGLMAFSCDEKIIIAR